MQCCDAVLSSYLLQILSTGFLILGKDFFSTVWEWDKLSFGIAMNHYSTYTRHHEVQNQSREHEQKENASLTNKNLT